jgi:hypothetical protein
LRNILSRIVLFFVISAILKNQLTAQLVDILRFNVSVKIIKKFVDRKDLFFSIQQIHHFSFFNFEDLRFLIFIFDINILLIKIIVYEDFINNFVQIKKALILFYIKVEATSNQLIKQFDVIMKKCSRQKNSRFMKISFKRILQFEFSVSLI